MSSDAQGRRQTHRALRSNTGHLGAGLALCGLQPSPVLQLDKAFAPSPEVTSLSLCKCVSLRLVRPAIINSEIPCPKAPAFSSSLPTCGSHTHGGLLSLVLRDICERTRPSLLLRWWAQWMHGQYLNPNPTAEKLTSLSELHFPPLRNRVDRVILRIKFCPPPPMRWIFLSLKFHVQYDRIRGVLLDNPLSLYYHILILCIAPTMNLSVVSSY